ncbi:coniferyl-alcohol dehydrogenase [Paraglaciecola arctica]|uniref:coniferyl-alcohol dehydrogenase n=1 Tax=Paraglaciecola arctica TaxID=1128911 RepID=UPI001C068D21|nr:coniferyl-alcohol dehydrogenase [Paraglaciecola arctica]MBU3002950.1 coniferyl-alcohol dehydrogenase [Paraglaciecola arctica]
MLNNKTIVVTGVASGIGAHTAKLLKQQGATVVGLDRNIASENIDKFIQVDLTEQKSIDEAIAQIDGIDGLCNIAGLPPTLDRDMVMTVNFVALRYLTEGLISKMNHGASIVNVASLAGIGWPQSVDAVKDTLDNINFDNVAEFCDKHDVAGPRSYFFSKEALLVWTMRNRWQWRDRGIRMNCVSPGPVDTPILKDFIETLGDRAEEDMKVMDRAGTPEDIAPVIVFLLRDDSAWIRGANIPVDGGMSSHVMEQIHNLA